MDGMVVVDFILLSGKIVPHYKAGGAETQKSQSIHRPCVNPGHDL
jgi:hypothetical protein